MELDLRVVAATIRQAETEDLLDRVTIYRNDMEPAAVDLMEHELARRGLFAEAIDAHETERASQSLFDDDGFVIRCAFCDRPAISQTWSWHKLWNVLPLFPRWIARCGEHGGVIQEIS